ncbi:MAG: hypothetical protein KDI61_01555 [Alphaproteobacteria bacterium]|nr:hypothetical protein [Alphaproteobacteria bacterium]
MNKGAVDFAVWCLFFVGLFTLLIALSVSFSQFMFKSSERVLTVDPDGWTTQVGVKSGKKSWQEIESVKEDRGKIIIASKNGNALIIPETAFPNSEFRHKFFTDAQEWKNTHK